MGAHINEEVILNVQRNNTPIRRQRRQAEVFSQGFCELLDTQCSSPVEACCSAQGALRHSPAESNILALTARVEQLNLFILLKFIVKSSNSFYWGLGKLV